MNVMEMTKTKKLTVSAMVMALYIVILYFTQGFSFGAYQIRIATSMYALGYFCPFLIVPLGLANFIANMLFGGLGILDMVGGCLVGMATTASVAYIGKRNWSPWLVVLPIIFIPGLGVSSWLSVLLKMPYTALAISLCIGQFVPAVCGAGLIKVTGKYTEKASGRIFS